MAEKLDAFGMAFLSAIRHGLETEKEYPFAMINQDGSFCIMCKKGQEDGFAGLLPVFSDMCEEQGIPMLPGKTSYTSSRDVGNAQYNEFYVKYEFNVAPETLHQLWMHESSYYSGYHQGGSILRLLDPEKKLMKNDVICLFPTKNLEDNNFLLRIAGCNTTETIATQLAFLIQTFETDEAAASCYGHYSNHIVGKYLPGINAQEDLLIVALNCLGLKKEFYLQDAAGDVVITIPEAATKYIKDMNAEATTIYTELAATMPDELPLLNSIEVPTMDYLNQLIVRLEEKIQYSKERWQYDMDLRIIQRAQTAESFRLLNQELSILEEAKNIIDGILKQVEQTQVERTEIENKSSHIEKYLSIMKERDLEALLTNQNSVLEILNDIGRQYNSDEELIEEYTGYLDNATSEDEVVELQQEIALVQQGMVISNGELLHYKSELARIERMVDALHKSNEVEISAIMQEQQDRLLPIHRELALNTQEILNLNGTLATIKEQYTTRLLQELKSDIEVYMSKTPGLFLQAYYTSPSKRIEAASDALATTNIQSYINSNKIGLSELQRRLKQLDQHQSYDPAYEDACQRSIQNVLKLNQKIIKKASREIQEQDNTQPRLGF